MTTKIALVANSAWYLANFRLNLARALLEEGYEVIALAPPGDDSARIEAAGVRFVPLSMDNKGTNPARDLTLFFRLVRLLRQERPAAVFSWTPKPNIYGGLACRVLGIPSSPNVAGLGTVFVRETWVTRVVITLYRLGLKNAETVFFQNPDDRELFLKLGIARPEQSRCLPGSGVDLETFSPHYVAERYSSAPIQFLLIARMLWDKGVGEFVEAARILKAEGRTVEFRLLGFTGAINPTAIPIGIIKAWEREGLVSYLGTAEDVRPHIADADCIVLPSYYREGTPRCLLEAAAMARPIITTDTVGCREALDDGETGFLCRAKDGADLADKMSRIMDMSEYARGEMGRRGRVKMEKQFDEQIVIDHYCEAARRMTS